MPQRVVDPWELDGVTGGCEVLDMGDGKGTWGPLQEQYSLLTEPLLRPQLLWKQGLMV